MYCTAQVLDGSTVSLLPVARNLVDVVWGEGRPGCPDNSIFLHPLEYSGEPLLHTATQSMSLNRTVMEGESLGYKEGAREGRSFSSCGYCS